MNIEQLTSALAKIREEEYQNNEGVRWLTLDWDAWTGDGNIGKCCGFCNGANRFNTIGRGTSSRNLLKLAHGKFWDNRKAVVLRDYWKDPFEFFDIDRLAQNIWNNQKPLVLMVTECHADLAYFVTPVDHVINIDFHRDDVEYEYVHCGSWAAGLTNYEHFDDIGNGYDRICSSGTPFLPHLIHICQSSPWTYRTADSQFYFFVEQIAQLCKCTFPLFYGHRKNSLARAYRRMHKKAA